MGGDSVQNVGKVTMGRSHNTNMLYCGGELNRSIVDLNIRCQLDKVSFQFLSWGSEGKKLGLLASKT